MKVFFLSLILSIVFVNTNLYSQLKDGGRTHEDAYYSIAVSPAWGIALCSSSDTYHGFDINLELRAGKSIGDGYIAYANLVAGRLFGNLLADDGLNKTAGDMPGQLGFNQITLGGGIVRFRKREGGYYSLALGATSLSTTAAAPNIASAYLGGTINTQIGFENWLSNNTSMAGGIGLSYSPLFSVDSKKSGSLGLLQMSIYIFFNFD